MDPVKFVERHGVVLEGGRGPRPNLAEAIAGGRIRGSWWGHQKGREIFQATRTVRDSNDVLVCGLLDGKVTYIHRRLWPAIIRLAHALDKSKLAAVHEEHTPTGAHRVRSVQFPNWVPPDVSQAAQRLSEEEAISQIGDWISKYLAKMHKPSRVKPGR